MVATIQEVNIKEAYISETDNRVMTIVNPNQLTGYDNWQDAIIIRDENHNELDPQPSHTNQDFIDWETTRLDDISQAEIEDDSIDATLATYDFSRADAVLALQIMTLIANTPNDDIDTTYQNFIDVLLGTNLEIPLKAYVQKDATITSFNPNTISDADKVQITDRAIDYLMAGLLVWIGKAVRG